MLTIVIEDLSHSFTSLGIVNWWQTKVRDHFSDMMCCRSFPILVFGVKEMLLLEERPDLMAY
jgi:hypothetical protein